MADVPIRFHLPIVQQFWESLLTVNKTKDLYHLYWTQFIPMQNQSPETKRIVYNEFKRIVDKPISIDIYTKLLLGFGALYVSDSSLESPESKIQALQFMIKQLRDMGIDRSNITVLCYNNCARAYHDLNDLAQAYNHYTKCIELDSQFASAYYNRAITCDSQSYYRRAIADYTIAIRLNPLYSRAYNNRGICYNTLKDYDSAISDYTNALEIDPLYTKAWNNRAISYYLKSDFKSALHDTMKALEIDHQYGNANFNQALCYKCLGNHVLALQSLNNALLTTTNDDQYLRFKQKTLTTVLKGSNRINELMVLIYLLDLDALPAVEVLEAALFFVVAYLSPRFLSSSSS
jgi:tetratricopeptide (TPR) repeat protein